MAYPGWAWQILTILTILTINVSHESAPLQPRPWSPHENRWRWSDIAETGGIDSSCPVGRSCESLPEHGEHQPCWEQGWNRVENDESYRNWIAMDERMFFFWFKWLKMIQSAFLLQAKNAVPFFTNNNCNRVALRGLDLKRHMPHMTDVQFSSAKTLVDV